MTNHKPNPATGSNQNRIHSTLMCSPKPLTDQVIAAVAEAMNCSKRELDPLYQAIDPDALNHLFAPTYNGESRASGWIKFEYAGFEVAIENAETVTVHPIDQPNE